MGHWQEDYEQLGYRFPVRVMTEAQTSVYRDRLQQTEAHYSNDSNKKKLIYAQPATVTDFTDEIARLPSIVDPVKAILGDNILLWNASFFIKEPQSPSFISWHQDLKYWGLDESHEVTAWVALSDVTSATGCMKFIPKSHKLDMVAHVDTFDENNLLSRGQEIAVDVDESQAVHVELKPGEMSLHHGKLFHGSSPNQTDERRIGLALRYITTDMRQSSSAKPYAKLIAGKDEFGYFQLMDSPTGVMDPHDVDIANDNSRIQEQFLMAGAKPTA